MDEDKRESTAAGETEDPQAVDEERSFRPSRAALREAERLRIKELLTNPQPGLAISDMALLAEHHLVLGAQAMRDLTEANQEDNTALLVALTVASADTNLGRGFAELARLKHDLGFKAGVYIGRAPWMA